MKYLIQINQKTEGPYTLEELKKIVGVTRENLIWNNTLDNWTRLGDLVDIPLTEEEELILNSPPTANKVNGLVGNILVEEKKSRIVEYSVITSGVIGLIYCILLVIIYGMIENGGTDSFPIYRSSRGSGDMIFEFFTHTIIYLLLTLGVAIVIIWNYVNKSPGLNPIIGSEKNNPKKYLGKWYKNTDNGYYDILSYTFYINGELIVEREKKNDKGYWWVYEGKFYYNLENEKQLNTSVVFQTERGLFINEGLYGKNKPEEKHEPLKNISPQKEEDSKSSVTFVTSIIVLGFIAIVVFIIQVVGNNNPTSKIETTPNQNIENEPAVDTSKKVDTSKVDFPTDDYAGYKTIKSEYYGYSFKIPSSFQPFTQTGANIEYSYSSPEGFSVISLISEEQNLSEEYLRNSALENYQHIREDVEILGFSNPEIIKSNTMYINNRLSYYLVYTYDLNNKNIYSEHITQVRGNKVFMISLGCPSSLRDKFSTYFDNIKNSID